MSGLTRWRWRAADPGFAMALLGGRRSYDRTHLLRQAERAARRQRRRRAIALYRRVLAVEPHNPELHARLAPLLATTGQEFDAWLSYKQAARAQVRGRDMGRALGTWQEATRELPRCVEAWLNLAELQRRMGQRQRAFETLREARRHFRGRRLRPQAIHLLRQALRLAPGNVDTALDLARCLAAAGRGEEAERLLAETAERSWGPDLRRVRATQWRVAPTLHHTWLLLRTAV